MSIFGLAVSINSCTSKEEPKPARTDLPGPIEKEKIQTEFYLGVDTMKLSKDRLNNPLSIEDKKKVIIRAKELDISHVSVDTPYDSPPGTNAVKETREWVELIRESGLFVTHRHMFTKFEGIYDQEVDKSINFIEEMRKWMINNADLIKDGDTWTPMPEPSNGTIQGVNCSTDNKTCMFSSPAEFNEFIRNIVNVSQETLKELNKDRVEVICCGFDLFIASGNNNPDWEGKSFLEKETIEILKCPSFDHYPQRGYNTGNIRSWRQDLDQLSSTWPNLCYLITEFGLPETGSPDTIESIFDVFEKEVKEGRLKGVFLWPFNPSDKNTDEGLLNLDFTPKPIFYEVKKRFAKLATYR